MKTLYFLFLFIGAKAFAEQTSAAPMVAAHLTITSVDDKEITAFLPEHKKVILPRSAIDHPVTDGKPHIYEISPAEWNMARFPGAQQAKSPIPKRRSSKKR